ncbi:MAG: hypothetical protein U5N55_12435 [Cypionkella sp.]|nr:hypothetical protein [Cypionkella sp.]
MNTVAKQYWALTGFAMAMMAAGLIWAAFEARQFQETLVWIKPFKFALSFVVLFATLAWVTARLSAAAQSARALKWTVAIMAAAFWFEMIYIAAQAAQGLGSHYNLGDWYHQIMYGLMGLGAVSLVVGTALVGWVALRDTDARLGSDLRFGVGVGFILSCVLTLITAGALSSMAGHFVGTPPAGAAVIPLFGWSAAVGDLRPAHFLALHAMQAIPLLAWIVQGRSMARGWIIGGAAAYTALTMALFVQALMGLPMVRL